MHRVLTPRRFRRDRRGRTTIPASLQARRRPPTVRTLGSRGASSAERHEGNPDSGGPRRAFGPWVGSRVGTPRSQWSPAMRKPTNDTSPKRRDGRDGHEPRTAVRALESRKESSHLVESVERGPTPAGASVSVAVWLAKPSGRPLTRPLTPPVTFRVSSRFFSDPLTNVSR